MKDIESLLARSRKYLQSSELLLKAGDYESSVSRAYYSMFFAAEAALLLKGLSFSSHKGVLTAFGKHFIKTGLIPKELGRELNRAYQKRQLSDYEFSFVITRKEAEEILRSAQKFVQEISKFLSENS